MEGLPSQKSEILIYCQRDCLSFPAASREDSCQINFFLFFARRNLGALPDELTNLATLDILHVPRILIMHVDTPHAKSIHDERECVPRAKPRRLAFVPRSYVDFAPRYDGSKGAKFLKATAWRFLCRLPADARLAHCSRTRCRLDTFTSSDERLARLRGALRNIVPDLGPCLRIRRSSIFPRRKVAATSGKVHFKV